MAKSSTKTYRSDGPKVHRLVIDFMRGLSPVGLARKYGKTVKQVEAIIRRELKR